METNDGQDRRQAALGLHPISSARFSRDIVGMKNKILLISFLIALVALAGMGCNTANGFGKDVSDAGQGIQNGTK